jgi:hypothetical protein
VRSRPFRARGLPDSSAGLNLAIELKRCIAEGATIPAEILNGSCRVLRRSYFGDGPDSVARLGGYIIGDDGWRWDAGARAGTVRVFRDPIFNVDGPIFGVQAHRITVQAQSLAPAYLSNTIVPAMEEVRECILLRADELRGGSWNGDARSLPRFLAEVPGSPSRCEVRIDNAPNGSDSWFLLISAPGLPWPLRVEFRPVATMGDFPSWELRFRDETINYLIDRQGRWHEHIGSPASLADPAPAQCYFDPRVPCE